MLPVVLPSMRRLTRTSQIHLSFWALSVDTGGSWPAAGISTTPPATIPSCTPASIVARDDQGCLSSISASTRLRMSPSALGPVGALASISASTRNSATISRGAASALESDCDPFLRVNEVSERHFWLVTALEVVLHHDETRKARHVTSALGTQGKWRMKRRETPKKGDADYRLDVGSIQFNSRGDVLVAYALICRMKLGRRSRSDRGRRKAARRS